MSCWNSWTDWPARPEYRKLLAAFPVAYKPFQGCLILGTPVAPGKRRIEIIRASDTAFYSRGDVDPIMKETSLSPDALSKP